MKILASLLMLTALSAFASEPPASKTPPQDSGGTAQVQNFEDLLVQGKYHFSDEAVTTVESDKVLDSLLGIRTDFKDRMAKSAGRD